MKTSRAPSQSVWEFRVRDKPRLRHLLIGLVVSALSYGFLWQSSRFMLAEWVVQVLSVGQVSVVKVFGSEAPQLVVRLLDGSDLALALTWQRTGLVSLAIFGLLFLFLLFPLQGSIWRKIGWLELGFVLGVTWSLIRLSITILIAYHFGAVAFTVSEFLFGPFTDFVWVVSLWSLALSALVSAKAKNAEGVS